MIIETALLGGAAAAMLAGLSLSASHGPGWLVIAGSAVPAFLVWLRIPASHSVRSLLRATGMRAPHAALLAEATAVGIVVFLVPFYLQDVKGLSATAAGAVVLAFPLSTMLASPLAGVLADMSEARRIALAGAVVFTAGLVVTAPLSSGWSAADLAWRLALIGAGAGLFAGPNQTVAMTSAPPGLLGVTGASTSLARQVGFSLGPAVATSIWALSGYSTLGVRSSVAAAAGLGLLALLCLAHPDVRRGIGRRNPSGNLIQE
jgi:MFS family permease